jgi:hypothetical protein
MNSDTVLSKIMTLLSVDKKEEVNLAFARLDDGTVLESPSFDVGEPVEVVGEDGEKSPAPAGEHTLTLRDEEGNEVRFIIIVEEGRITEREPAEELQAETKEVEPLPNTTDEPEANTVEFETEETEEVEAKEEKMTELEKKLEDMTYRLEEIEKKLMEEPVEEEMEEEEDDDKLTGAPVEMSRKTFGKSTNPNKVLSTHERVLAKLYN